MARLVSYECETGLETRFNWEFGEEDRGRVSKTHAKAHSPADVDACEPHARIMYMVGADRGMRRSGEGKLSEWG